METYISNDSNNPINWNGENATCNCCGETLDMSDYEVNVFVAGFCNVTAAITGVQFSYSTGNIQSGIIKMYGVSK